MKLRNKKTGLKVDNPQIGVMENQSEGRFMLHDAIYDSLADLTEEWEDYEEPILISGVQEVWQDLCEARIKFATPYEAEKAVEKLKALKRLKDAGFRFKGIECIGDNTYIEHDFSGNHATIEECANLMEDLSLLFGGEE